MTHLPLPCCLRRSDPGAKTTLLAPKQLRNVPGDLILAPRPRYWRQNSGEKSKHGVTDVPRPCCPRRYEGPGAKTTLLAPRPRFCFHTHSNTSSYALENMFIQNFIHIQTLIQTEKIVHTTVAHGKYNITIKQ